MFDVFIILAGPQNYSSSYSDNCQLFCRYVQFERSRPSRRQQWYHDWTIFYWAWWISWSPLLEYLLQNLKRAYSKRILTVVMSAPLLFSLIWFSSFGTTAISQYEANIGSLPNNTGDMSLVLFLMLENLFSNISSLFALAFWFSFCDLI